MKKYQITENHITYDIYQDNSGTKYWYKNEKPHREDGPAVIYYNGNKEWYKDGVLHRDDGHSIEWDNGYKSWWKNGERHRDDGPAIEYSYGKKEYWYNGKRLESINSNEELKRYIKFLSIS